MTFLDAAIEVLRQAGRPLPLKDLVTRAIQLKLLSHEGRDPEATMQARLAQELKKGGHSPLVKTSAGHFGLHRYDRPAQSPPPVLAADAVTVETPVVAAVATDPAAPGEGGRRRRRRRGGRGRKRGGAGASPGVAGAPVVDLEEDDADEGNEGAVVAAPVVVAPAPASDAGLGDPEHAFDEHVEEGTPEEAIFAARLAEEAELEAAAMSSAVTMELPIKHLALMDQEIAAAKSEGRPVDLDALVPTPTRRFPHIVELPSEDTLAQEYADEVGAVQPPVEGEIIDERTADEDRPMLAEIQGRDRERERRERRRGRGRDCGAPPHANAQTPPHAPAQHAPPPHRQDRHGTPRPLVEAPVHVQVPVPGPAPLAVVPSPPTSGNLTDLADVAHQVLRSLNDPRPVHARQLAAMALKRKLTTGDAEEVWRAMRGALITDARLRQAAGLRPRIRHHGGSLFALARLEDELRTREEALAQKVDELGAATLVALQKRLQRLPPLALEQLVRVFLPRCGWRNVERVKRSDETWYLTASTRRGATLVTALIGVRAGANEIGRKAVGELRAGVLAKQLDEGVLFAPARLGAEGEREINAHGQLVTVYDGEAFARELVTAGVGVQRAIVPVAYLDIDFFADLTEA